MIIKGKSRAAPMRLAKHLERTDTNEHVEMLVEGLSKAGLEVK